MAFRKRKKKFDYKRNRSYASRLGTLVRSGKSNDSVYARRNPYHVNTKSQFNYARTVFGV